MFTRNRTFTPHRKRWLVMLPAVLVFVLGSGALAEGGHAEAEDDHRAGMSTGAEITEPADVHYTLRTSFSAGAIGFIGVGGAIDGVLNPELRAEEGEIVEITLVNGDGVEHDVTLPNLGLMAEHVAEIGETSTVKFRAAHEGAFEYQCAVPGHRVAGMYGVVLVVSGDHAHSD